MGERLSIWLIRWERTHYTLFADSFFEFLPYLLGGNVPGPHHGGVYEHLVQPQDLWARVSVSDCS